MDGVFGDAFEDVGQVGLRVDAVHLCCFDDGVDAGGALASGVRDASIMLLSLLLRTIEFWLVAGRCPTSVVRSGHSQCPAPIAE